jgi:hypothetical protein
MAHERTGPEVGVGGGGGSSHRKHAVGEADRIPRRTAQGSRLNLAGLEGVLPRQIGTTATASTLDCGEAKKPRGDLGEREPMSDGTVQHSRSRCRPRPGPHAGGRATRIPPGSPGGDRQPVVWRRVTTDTDDTACTVSSRHTLAPHTARGRATEWWWLAWQQEASTRSSYQGHGDERTPAHFQSIGPVRRRVLRQLTRSAMVLHALRTHSRSGGGSSSHPRVHTIDGVLPPRPHARPTPSTGLAV